MCPVWVHRFAVVTAGATLVLIFVGALVTSTGSGLAVPDWPLSFGQVFPPMVGGVLFEHGHRLVAAFVGVLTVTLMVLLTRWEPRAWVRWLARGAALAVVLQGALGGVTVLLRLPLAVSVTHACLAQAFLCLVITLAVCTSPGWQAHPAGRVEQRQPALWLSGGHHCRHGLRAAHPGSTHAAHGSRPGYPRFPAGVWASGATAGFGGGGGALSPSSRGPGW